jgi:membrane fusion protein, multidrug efflux system
MNPLAVRIEKATKVDVEDYYEAIGELIADQEIRVSAERAGQISAIYVKEGDFVSEGQLLVSIKGKDVKADLKLAESDYETYKKLYEEGAISQQELLGYETRLDRIKSQLDNLEIEAKFSGTIGEIFTDPGAYVNPGDPILDLIKNRPLRASYYLPEKLIPYIKLNQELSLKTDIYPEKEFKAYVDFIAPQLDKENRTLLVRASVLDPESLLKSNLFINVKQKIQKIEQTIMVREEALYLDQGQEFLYIALPLEKVSEDKNTNPQASPSPSHLAERRAVQTGIRKPGYVEILSGLDEGDLLIYAGLHSIYPGAQLIEIKDKNES